MNSDQQTVSRNNLMKGFEKKYYVIPHLGVVSPTDANGT